ncbi:SPFH domain-containing protein [Gymnodinialimonas sp. 2305UL16-5]
MVTVGPAQRAVLSEGGAVVSLLDPGLHAYNRATQQLTIYDAHVSQQLRVRGAVMVEDCPADVTVTYNIGDVLVFHQSGGNADQIAAMVSTIRGVLADMDLRLDTPLGEAMNAVRQELREIASDGMNISHVAADLGECAPPPPRILTDRVERLPIELGGVLGAQRADMPDLELFMTDSVRLQLLNAVATYDVVDPNLSATCFGERGADTIVTDFTAGRLRYRLASYPSTELTTGFEAVAEALESEGADLVEQCGVEVGAIDVSDAVLWRIERVNCTETPEAEICLEAD